MARRRHTLLPFVAALFLLDAGVSAQSPTEFEYRQGLDSGFGPYVGVHDTYIDSRFPTDAFGSGSSIWSDAIPDTWQILMRFDDIVGRDPGEIHPGSYLSHASFRFRTYPGSGGSAGTHQVRWLTEAWDDSTLTYGNQFGGNGIQSSETAGLAVNIGPTSSGATINTDFTPVVQGWLDGLVNEGFVIMTGHSDALGILSSETPDETQRPTLTVHTLPQGPIAHADAVVSFTQGGGGGSPNPLDALGGYGSGTVSLGYGGVLILEFTDNALTGSGDDAIDLWIYEVGAASEGSFVAISKDGVNWFDLGLVNGGIDGIDIDAAGHGPEDRFHFVRLIDDNLGNNLPSPGADIQGIAANDSAAWQYIGPVLASASSAPKLSATGHPAEGVTTAISLRDAPPNGVAHFIIGFSFLNAKFKGGTLIPSLDIVKYNLPVDGNGEFAIQTVWPSSTPAGLELFIQAWMPDASGPAGFVASNALRTFSS